MNEREHMEIIASSENPDVSFGDVAGRPPSVEHREWLAEFGDSLFDQCSLEEKVEELSDLPIEIAARRVARQSESEQARILSRLPDELMLGNRIVTARRGCLTEETLHKSI